MNDADKLAEIAAICANRQRHRSQIQRIRILVGVQVDKRKVRKKKKTN